MTTMMEDVSAGTRIIEATRLDTSVRIAWANGERRTVQAIWLRDNCPCPECCHPGSEQRLLDTMTIPRDLTPASLTVSDDGDLEVAWQPEQHTSTFSAAWLYDNLFPSAEPILTLWDAAMMSNLPAATNKEVESDTKHLYDWLAAVDRYGFALLHDVPVEPGSIFSVVDLFGYVRETNYGRLFDVQSVINPSNLAYTGLLLGPHTDNPYRDPTPTLQLLHCLSSSVMGGDTTLVDGFRVAEDLRRSAPALFELLSHQPLSYRYRDGATELSAEFPVISCDERGGVQAIHFNNRSKMPVVLPDHIVEPYYEAYQTFARMLVSPIYQISLRLEPGDLVIIDNLRILHGRTGFSAAGERRLQGCYADRDGLRSRLVVLNRSHDGTRLPEKGISVRKEAIVDEIFARFAAFGSTAYIGEPVSVAEHMLQSAQAAEEDGAGPTLITAALLHDYGHLLHDLPEDAAERGIDTRHEDLAFELLAPHFVPAVVEPVRLHVAAKRYLCAIDSAYMDALSPASILSLTLQGGPMTPWEVEEFARSPYAEDAVRLRKYDDIAKVPGAPTPGLEHYRPIVESCIE